MTTVWQLKHRRQEIGATTRRPVHPDGASGRADAKPWEHRAVIEQAEGIIMGEWRCSCSSERVTTSGSGCSAGEGLVGGSADLVPFIGPSTMHSGRWSYQRVGLEQWATLSPAIRDKVVLLRCGRGLAVAALAWNVAGISVLAVAAYGASGWTR